MSLFMIHIKYDIMYIFQLNCSKCKEVIFSWISNYLTSLNFLATLIVFYGKERAYCFIAGILYV